MGGSLDRVTVLPVVEGVAATANTESWVQAVLQAKANFELFDVERSTCTSKEDTQRLLACIELGFGSYAPFNQLIRQLFDERLQTQPSQSKSSEPVQASDLAPGKSERTQWPTWPKRAKLATVLGAKSSSSQAQTRLPSEPLPGANLGIAQPLPGGEAATPGQVRV